MSGCSVPIETEEPVSFGKVENNSGSENGDNIENSNQTSDFSFGQKTLANISSGDTVAVPVPLESNKEYSFWFQNDENSDGGLTFQVLSGLNVPLTDAFLINPNNLEIATVTVSSPENVFIEITPDQNDEFYVVYYQVEDPDQVIFDDTTFEPNFTSTIAYEISSDATYTANLGSGDNFDWYKLNVSNQDTVELNVTNFNTSEGGIYFSIFDEDLELRSSRQFTSDGTTRTQTVDIGTSSKAFILIENAFCCDSNVYEFQVSLTPGG